MKMKTWISPTNLHSHMDFMCKNCRIIIGNRKSVKHARMLKTSPNKSQIRKNTNFKNTQKLQKALRTTCAMQSTISDISNASLSSWAPKK